MYNNKDTENKTDLKKIKEISEKIKNAMQYFENNAKRYIDFMRFICESNLSESIKNKLSQLNKPCIEFNQCEAYINRQLGEFAAQNPSFEIKAMSGLDEENFTPEFLKTIEVLEGFLNHLLNFLVFKG